MSSKKIHLSEGDVLIHEGDIGESAYIIEHGSVEILIKKDGKTIPIGTRGAGSIIGEMSMIDNKPRTATVRATEDCQVIEISRQEFARRLDASDPIIKMVMHVIVTRYRDMFPKVHGDPSLDISSNALEKLENENELHDIAVSRIKATHDLQEAIKKKELCLYYQPIIDINEMKIAGFEALMRWIHPEKGMISPMIFIPIAEESDLILDLSQMALEDSCDAVKQLQAAINPDKNNAKELFLSVNFSVKDFSTEDFFTGLKQTLESKSVNPWQIKLEITENLLMESPDKAKEALTRCRDYGLGISIDDFGTGYSSLGYLHKFPISTLKIDKSFISAMSEEESSLVLVKGIVAMARNLGLSVIAEGIETQEEAKILKEMQCDNIQGYYFGKPMPLENAIEFVQNWEPEAL